MAAVVLDPCFAATSTEIAARESGLIVEWHRGFRLAVDDLGRQADYRGQSVVEFGRSIAERGCLDARLIGNAVNDGAEEQLAKRLWHCLARFGSLGRPVR